MSVTRTFKGGRGLGRGGMMNGIRNTLPDQTGSPIDRTDRTDTFLAQWEMVAEAWDHDFDAYCRHVGVRP